MVESLFFIGDRQKQNAFVLKDTVSIFEEQDRIFKMLNHMIGDDEGLAGIRDWIQRLAIRHYVRMQCFYFYLAFNILFLEIVAGKSVNILNMSVSSDFQRTPQSANLDPATIDISGRQKQSIVSHDTANF